MQYVAKGPKFRQQNTKGTEQNCAGAGKIWGRTFGSFIKKGRKGAAFFVVKMALFLVENCNFPLIYSNFHYYFAV
jgi:hypothetical protein